MKKFSTFTEWTTSFAQQGCFDHINQLMAFDEWHKWPSCKALQTLLPYEVENLNGKTIKFVDQEEGMDFSAVAYEEFIYKRGEVPTRKNSWHDIFGAMSWCLFPKTKALLNKLHHDDIKQNGTQQRSTLRNALTLFDECGVVLVSQNVEVLQRLKEHDWQSAFVDNCELWYSAGSGGVAVYPFGHANYEMMTKPFIGLTGKWLHLEMSAEVMGLPLNVQYRLIDERLSEKIKAGALNDNSQMSPLPLLGIPGWFDDNQNPEFYANTDYFRPKRTT